MVRLGEHFRSDERSRHSEWLQKQQWFIKSRQEKEQRQQASDNLDEEITSLAASVVIATQAEVIDFQTKLDAYDEATVKALMENREQLELVRAQIEDLLEQAYVMEDGRRVFKSEDGSFVVDEHGAFVAPEELDPDLIPDKNPTAETFLKKFNFEKDLLTEQQELLEFQNEVDAAREKTADDDISKSDLGKLDTELENLMPDIVRAELGIEEAVTSNLDRQFDHASGEISVGQNINVLDLGL